MKAEEMSHYHETFNSVMEEQDDFFKIFGRLDDNVYSDGAISAKNKQLMGLAISVTTKCNPCILYHIKGSIKTGSSKAEMVEAIKTGVIAGGTLTYPNARFAFEMLKELEVI
ncbi:carboxymuconolactone decarboxylase family protein [Terrilactibacillus sp. S3-3]|nr:carboxymuconolactone decarboxylase family protein [Terrilactibacillus sp. S3-3]